MYAHIHVYPNHLLNTWNKQGIEGQVYVSLGFPSGEESDCRAGDAGDVSLIPGSGRSPGGGHGNHSSIRAWRIPWTEEAGGLQSTGSHRVGHDWACARAHTHAHFNFKKERKGDRREKGGEGSKWGKVFQERRLKKQGKGKIQKVWIWWKIPHILESPTVLELFFLQRSPADRGCGRTGVCQGALRLCGCSLAKPQALFSTFPLLLIFPVIKGRLQTTGIPNKRQCAPPGAELPLAPMVRGQPPRPW